MIRNFLIIIAILAGVFLLAVGIMYFNAFLFNNKTQREIRTMRAIITPEVEIPYQAFVNSELPEPVARYLAFANVIDQKPIKYAYTRRKGVFRMSEDQDWMSLKGKTYHVTDSPAFIRDATMDAGFVSFCVREKYLYGKANVLGKLFGAFTVINENNIDVDRSSLLRYLADLPWVPTAFLSPSISWEPIDEIAARATISDGGHSVSAVFFFEPSGAISHIYAKDLFRDNATENWSCFYRNYEQFNGFMIPKKSEVTWNLDSGDFTYEKFDVVKIEYE